MIIRAKDIKVVYKKKRRCISAIEQVSFTAHPGEVAVITGRSGSGKTTLVNVLAGLLVPDEGQVFYDDVSIYRINDDQLSGFRCRHTAYIPQGAGALANLTVFQNILLPSALAGQNNNAYAEQLLAAVGLEKLTNAYPDELSGGELRRLAAARALINSPSFIIADEPTNDLDEENSVLILKLLKAQAERGAAVIIVTHDSTAFAYADRVFQMDGGRLICEENDNDNTLCRPLVS